MNNSREDFIWYVFCGRRTNATFGLFDSFTQRVVTMIFIIQSGHKFPHVATAQLSWHLQNCYLIESYLQLRTTRLFKCYVWRCVICYYVSENGCIVSRMHTQQCNPLQTAISLRHWPTKTLDIRESTTITKILDIVLSFQFLQHALVSVFTLSLTWITLQGWF